MAQLGSIFWFLIRPQFPQFLTESLEPPQNDSQQQQL